MLSLFDMGYSAHYTEKSFIEEAKRLGFLGDNSGWCVTKLNSRQSYPRLHLLPASVTEDELRQSSGYRALGRFPAPVWRCPANGAVLARSAQPLVGHYTAALCAMAPEAAATKRPEYYTGTEIEYLGLPNIHAIRNSFAALRAALGAACCGRDGSLASVASNSFSSNSSASATTVTYSSYASVIMDLRQLWRPRQQKRCKPHPQHLWGNYSTVSLAPAPAAPVCTAPPTSTTSSGVSSATAAAAAAAAAAQNASFLSDIERAGLADIAELVLVSEGRSVLVHCSDAFRRFPPADQSEWFEFGHKFADRCSGRDANERLSSRDALLRRLAVHCYSGLFISFLSNGPAETRRCRFKKSRPDQLRQAQTGAEPIRTNQTRYLQERLDASSGRSCSEGAATAASDSQAVQDASSRCRSSACSSLSEPSMESAEL
uniref:Myotubularin phosphatase domain-containing protein n=1 Tax=Macrostomum lignano TaxID=282301 RepID=A0A1I8JR36_9PLAT